MIIYPDSTLRINVWSFFFPQETSILFSTVVALIYILTNSAQGLHFLHILTNSCYFLSLILTILTGVKWYPTVVLLSISLMISDHEYLSMGLLAICMYSLGKMFIQVLSPFFNRIVCGKQYGSYSKN